MILVPGSNGKNIKAAYEETRHGIQSCLELKLAVQTAIDICTQSLHEAYDEWEDSNSIQVVTDDRIKTTVPDDFNDFLMHKKSSDQNVQLSGEPQDDLEEQGPNPDGRSDENEDSVEPLTYVPAQQSNFDPDAGRYPQTRELRNLGHVDATEPQMLTRSARRANVVELTPGTELNALESEYLKLYWDRFASKDFMAFEAQGLPQSVQSNAYLQQEEECLKAVSVYTYQESRKMRT